jgi:hypothetical protein
MKKPMAIPTSQGATIGDDHESTAGQSFNFLRLENSNKQQKMRKTLTIKDGMWNLDWNLDSCS